MRPNWQLPPGVTRALWDYLRDPAIARASDSRLTMLRHVFRVLCPGGVFALHIHNRWFNIWTRPGRCLVLADLVGSWLGRRTPGDYEMPPHQGLGSLTMHLFTRREIMQLLC